MEPSQGEIIQKLKMQELSSLFMTHHINVMHGWLVGCFGFNGPLRQYFSLYQAVSQREGERGEKG